MPAFPIVVHAPYDRSLKSWRGAIRRRARRWIIGAAQNHLSNSLCIKCVRVAGVSSPQPRGEGRGAGVSRTRPRPPLPGIGQVSLTKFHRGEDSPMGEEPGEGPSVLPPMSSRGPGGRVDALRGVWRDAPAPGLLPDLRRLLAPGGGDPLPQARGRARGGRPEAGGLPLGGERSGPPMGHGGDLRRCHEGRGPADPARIRGDPHVPRRGADGEPLDVSGGHGGGEVAGPPASPGGCPHPAPAVVVLRRRGRRAGRRLGRARPRPRRPPSLGHDLDDPLPPLRPAAHGPPLAPDGLRSVAAHALSDAGW